jgi:hypothetical protein
VPTTESTRHSDRIKKIATELSCYLEANPSARDTKEGIMKWWIARQRLTESIEAVEAALAWLKDRGEVEETTLPDGTKVYGRQSRGRIAS